MEGSARKEVRLGGWIELSAIDWPGNLTFMLFLSGCNLACPFCQNRRLIPLESGALYSLEDVEAKILESLQLLDALGFGGGEPTLQQEALEELALWAKGKGLKVFIETNGTRPEVLRKLLNSKLLSYVAIDVKAPFRNEDYGVATGKPSMAPKVIRSVKESLRLCALNQVPYEVRTTIVPGLTDREESISAISEELAPLDPVYVLQQFIPSLEVPSPQLREGAPISREILLKLARKAREKGISKVFIRTREHGLEGIDWDRSEGI
ncbi:MAG: anaerobic ribonucleoside-triphosphate reductase activating protein [Candidatus Bathyarchaeia archaeon]